MALYSNRGKFAIWQYKNFHVVAMSGRFPESLEKKRCIGDELDSEMFYLGSRDASVEALAGFCFDPMVSIRLIRSQDFSFMLARSFQLEFTVEFMNELEKLSFFFPDKGPDSRLITTYSRETRDLDVELYNQFGLRASSWGVTHEKLFMCGEFANLIHTCRDLPRGLAYEYARKRLSLPKDISLENLPK